MPSAAKYYTKDVSNEGNEINEYPLQKTWLLPAYFSSFLNSL